MTKIEAKIVADSINPQGDRITTYLLTFPRFILAELNTHRVFSKNSASSRAIPFEKMVKMVEEDPFIPIAWQKDHKGMQGNEYFDTHYSQTNDYNQDIHYGFWMDARDEAIRMATCLHDEGLTKQLCNRLLEPFMWHTVLLTGTEFSNFFKLRCPKYVNEHENGEDISYSRKDFISKLKKRYPTNWESDLRDFHGIENNEDWEWARLSKSSAEIHIQALAEAMWDAMNESTPKELKVGEWHIPFGDKIQLAYTDYDFNGIITNEGINKKIKISTARCARLSYMTFDGKINYEKDIQLHDRLLADGHMSPFEHCCRVLTEEEYHSFFKGELCVVETSDDWYQEGFMKGDKGCGWCNNYKGFQSYRYILENGT